jgi:hypothetical protein
MIVDEANASIVQCNRGSHGGARMVARQDTALGKVILYTQPT